MRLLFEEYGDAIIQAIGGICVLVLLFELVRSDGALHGLITYILDSAC